MTTKTYEQAGGYILRLEETQEIIVAYPRGDKPKEVSDELARGRYIAIDLVEVDDVMVERWREYR